MIKRLLFVLMMLPFVAAAQDWSKPDLLSSKTDFMTEMHDIINQCAKMDVAGTNVPIGSMRYNRGTDLFEEWSGSAWATAPLSATALGSGGVTSSMILDGTILSADISDGTITGTDIGDGQVASADIADGTVTSTDIANSTIVGADVADGSIASADITDDSIVAGDLAADSVGSSEISTNAVGADEIIVDGVGNSEIANDAVGSGEIAAGAVGNSELADNAVTGGKISDGTIGSSDIQDTSITGTDIALGTIVESNIWDGNITTAKIADGAVTNSKFNSAWAATTVSSTTLTDCGASCISPTSDAGTLRSITIGPIKYFYADLTYTASGTGDSMGFALPIAAANGNYSFNCVVGGSAGEAVVGISEGGSTTTARLIKVSGNYGTGSGRNIRCAGFYE